MDVSCRIIHIQEKMDGISQYTQNHDIGLIAILARKHNLLQKMLFGQRSRKLFMNTHIPILVFH